MTVEEIRALQDRAELIHDELYVSSQGDLLVPAKLAPVVIELLTAWKEIEPEQHRERTAA